MHGAFDGRWSSLSIHGYMYRVKEPHPKYMMENPRRKWGTKFTKDRILEPMGGKCWDSRLAHTQSTLLTFPFLPRGLSFLNKLSKVTVKI